MEILVDSLARFDALPTGKEVSDVVAPIRRNMIGTAREGHYGAARLVTSAYTRRDRVQLPAAPFLLPRRRADFNRTSRAHSRADVFRSNSSSTSVTATENTAVFASGFRGRPAPGRFPPCCFGFFISTLLKNLLENQARPT